MKIPIKTMKIAQQILCVSAILLVQTNAFCQSLKNENLSQNRGLIDQSFLTPSKNTKKASANKLNISHQITDTNDALNEAWRLFNLGNEDEKAAQLYRAILQKNSVQKDAILGLAALYLRAENISEARLFYEHALEIDPFNAHAIAALIELEPATFSGNHESRLKDALSKNPTSSALYFVLGNVYLREKRFADAQQAYFYAHTLEPENANALFNLAVSLEHLNKPALAISYYQKALPLTKNKAIHAKITARLEGLEKALENTREQGTQK